MFYSPSFDVVCIIDFRASKAPGLVQQICCSFKRGRNIQDREGFCKERRRDKVGTLQKPGSNKLQRRKPNISNDKHCAS